MLRWIPVDLSTAGAWPHAVLDDVNRELVRKKAKNATPAMIGSQFDEVRPCNRTRMHAPQYG